MDLRVFLFREVVTGRVGVKDGAVGRRTSLCIDESNMIKVVLVSI